MRILLVGAPGSGKGTQAQLLSLSLGLTHISSGDLLRDHVARRTALGRRVRSYVARGDLVPDAIVMDMLRKPVIKAVQRGGYILDGFPRTVEQALAAYGTARELGAAVQVAVHLDVPSAELVRRLLARGRGTDDTDDIIEHRLDVYQDRTLPMLDYYAQREQLVRVDAAAPIGKVHQAVLSQLEPVRRMLQESTT